MRHRCSTSPAPWCRSVSHPKSERDEPRSLVEHFTCLVDTRVRYSHGDNARGPGCIASGELPWLHGPVTISRLKPGIRILVSAAA